MRGLNSSPTIRAARAATNSAVRRPPVNAIVRRPAVTSPASRLAVVVLGETGTPSSATGGRHTASNRPPEGEPSSVTTDTSRPHISAANTAGSPIVADAKMKVGDDP